MHLCVALLMFATFAADWNPVEKPAPELPPPGDAAAAAAAVGSEVTPLWSDPTEDPVGASLAELSRDHLWYKPMGLDGEHPEYAAGPAAGPAARILTLRHRHYDSWASADLCLHVAAAFTALENKRPVLLSTNCAMSQGDGNCRPGRTLGPRTCLESSDGGDAMARG